MSAKIIQEGFTTVGFNEAGECTQLEVALVRAEVPGERGEWCFVVQGNDFCWVKGLGPGEGYRLYPHPLTGPQNEWQEQIERFLDLGPDENGEFKVVPAGDKSPLARDKVFIVAE